MALRRTGNQGTKFHDSATGTEFIQKKKLARRKVSAAGSLKVAPSRMTTQWLEI
jgi:hypothetical protein